MLRSIVAAAAVTLALITNPLAAQSAFHHYAEHTPGFKKVAEGSRSYERGWYFDAYHDWLWAAYWADKTAQYNLGVLYYHGQNVDRDIAHAWAWFKLAAERDYPLMVETTSAVATEMTSEQKLRGQAVLDRLRSEYSDEVALERTQRFMNRERRRMTGSRVGFAQGLLRIVSPDGRTRDGQEYYDKSRWDLDLILEQEAETWESLSRANVGLGDFVIKQDPDEQD